MHEDESSSTPRKSTSIDGPTSVTVEKERRTELRYEPLRGGTGPTSPPSQLSSLVDVLDMFEQGVLLLRSDLHPCYHNSAAAELLGADPQRDALTQEVRAVSRVALAGKLHATAEREVGTPAGTYRLRAKLLKQKLIDISSRTILVTIERAAPKVPSRDYLMRRFAMTGREAAVAALLARGASNSKIASELRISPHTARHHTENVLTKLNVHARAEVARAIVAGLPAR
jgi:DNA-binding CsgD family transcriptional regulator